MASTDQQKLSRAESTSSSVLSGKATNSTRNLVWTNHPPDNDGCKVKAWLFLSCVHPASQFACVSCLPCPSLYRSIGLPTLKRHVTECPYVQSNSLRTEIPRTWQEECEARKLLLNALVFYVLGGIFSPVSLCSEVV